MGLNTYAGFFSFLNEVSSNNKCHEYDEKEIKELFQEKSQFCKPINQKQNLKAPVRVSFEKLEEHFFDELATLHMKEYDCSLQFLEDYKKLSESQLESEFVKLKNINQLHFRLAQDVQFLSSPQNKGPKICPPTVEEAKKDLEEYTNRKTQAQNMSVSDFDSQPPPSYYIFLKTCERIHKNRVHLKEMESGVALSQLPSIRNLINEVKKMKSPISDNDLQELIKKSHGEAKKEILKEKRTLRDIVHSESENFNLNQKYQLLSNSEVIKKYLKGYENNPHLNHFMCYMDSRYKEGADEFGKKLIVGDIFVTLASMGWGKVALEGAKRAISLSRITTHGPGYLKVGNRLSKALPWNYAMPGLATVSGAILTAKLCSENEMKYKGRNDQCVSAPQVDEIEKQNCMLSGMLMFAGVGGLVQNTRFLSALNKYNVIRRKQKIDIQSHSVKKAKSSRSEGDREGFMNKASETRNITPPMNQSASLLKEQLHLLVATEGKLSLLQRVFIQNMGGKPALTTGYNSKTKQVRILITHYKKVKVKNKEGVEEVKNIIEKENRWIPLENLSYKSTTNRNINNQNAF